jgi:cytochrome c biogenesis protein CcdA
MMILTLIILPVYALYHVSSVYENVNANTSNAVCMGILLVATLLFSAGLSLFTKARRHEVLGASAA